jgi:hypothetical protein
MARLLLGAGVLALVVAASHPRGRRTLLRLAVWPLRDFLRRDHDEAEASRVAPRAEWIS